jgi:hypothetical protein
MGLLDILRGKRAVKAPAGDRLFAMSTAYVTFETQLGVRTRGVAGIVFQPLDTADFRSIVADMEEVLRATSDESGTTIQAEDDSFGYRWMVLRDPDFEDLVVGVNAVSSALVAGGYGERLLCAVFAFDADRRARQYWIYNYKRGAFYPFVPAPGEKQRDTERELKLKAQLGGELPIEQELERWFPLWDIPL